MPWTFLSNHAHVFMLLCQDPNLRIREVAKRVGITERATQRILHDLVAEGYLEVVKEGRCNRYVANRSAPLRHPLEQGITVGALVDGLEYANNM